MKNYLMIIPVTLLVAYSQLVVKWRINTTGLGQSETRVLYKLLAYLTDPFIISSTLAALLSGLTWIFVVARLQITVAFPIYYGLTFALVIIGGVIILREPMTTARLLAVTLILAGVIIGGRDCQ